MSERRASDRRPQVSVVVRCKDEAGAVGRAIRSVREQTVPAELVVVDSGSTDGTLQIVESAADRLLRISPDEFTYGGALNRGAEAASAPVHVALSAHCALPHERWLERAIDLLSRDRVGAAGGRRFRPAGRPLDATAYLDARALAAAPKWGLSNHASAWRAEVWRACPFDEQLAASEDLLFARTITERGWLVAVDPRLWVPAPHRAAAGPAALFRRRRKETRATATALDLPPFGVRDAARWWWTDVSRQPGRAFPYARLDPRRVPELAGIVAGYRDAGRLGTRRGGGR